MTAKPKRRGGWTIVGRMGNRVEWRHRGRRREVRGRTVAEAWRQAGCPTARTIADAKSDGYETLRLD